MLNPIFLEIANGTLAVSGLALLAVFARYIIGTQATERGRAAAIAIAVFVAGETIFRGWVWLWRHQINDGMTVDWMREVPAPAIGLIVAMVGAFCMMRVFSFARWPRWFWAGAMVVTVAVMTAIAMWN